MVRARRSRKPVRRARSGQGSRRQVSVRRLLWIGVGSVVAACVACLWAYRRLAPDDRDAKPHVILVSVDTLRPDHLSCYGYDRITSPNLDALASDGIRFTQVLSPASWTLPAHMSLMTSQYPHVHGVEVAQQALPDEATTLAELLSDHGYETAAFISWIYVAAKFGFAQGFDEFHELLPSEELVDSTTRDSFKAAQVTDRAIQWLQRDHPKPFFLFVHYFDPHLDYDPPPPFDRMFDPDYQGSARGTYGWIRPYIKGLHEIPNRIDPRDRDHVAALYDGEIRYTDRHLGRLFAAIDATVGLDRCVIILTSDHGEEFNEHGSMEGHQWTLYEETIRVPLLVRLPRRRQAGRVVTRPVELIDVPATILSLLGIKLPDFFQGRDRTGLLNGMNGSDDHSIAFGEIRRFVIRQYVRGSRYKLIHTFDTGVNKRGIPIKAGYELYDLLRDPGEQHDLYETQSPVARLLVQKLQEWNASPITGLRAGEPRNVILTPRELERLRSLGYVD